LAYTDASGVARVITGITENVVSGQPAGAIYVKGIQLRWVSANSPYYEYILAHVLPPTFMFVGDQDTDKVTRINLTDLSETTIDVGAITSGVSSLYHDGTNLWICGKPDRKVFKLDGFSDTVLVTYDFTGNADVNSSNAFVGLYVDTVEQRLYVANFVNLKVIKGTSGFGTTTDTAITLTGTPTGITIYGGELYTVDFTNYQANRYLGFSSTLVNTLNLGTTLGRPYGISFTNAGDLVVLFQNAGGANDFIRIYDGFSTTVKTTITSSANWNLSPQGIAFSTV